jgi:FlaA1/EpsC-like NDP-sugar epimerase
MEQYPSEAIKNNVVGTLNVVELSVEHEVEHFVMVSTDKAVDPSSVMGATKRLGEMIVKGYAASTGMNMVSVRFGNVLGSRGSVVPTMKRRILQGQCINITDPEMVRFFMTIPEASRLILQAGAVGGCGEVFILDMGEPVRILDLAHDLIRLSGLVPGQDVEIRITGRRPGEKIREEILTEKESIEAEKRGPFFMALPENIELASLLEQIEALRLSAMQNNTAAVVNGIAGIVPNFHPDRGVHKNGIMISECPAPDAPFMENGLPPKHLVS